MTTPSSKRPLRFGFLLAAALASVPVHAHAADTPQDRAEAKRLYAEAKKLRSAGKHEEALDRFRRAHALMATPVTRLELAQALEGQKKLVEAHALLVSIADMPVTPTETQKGRTAREEAQSLAASLAPRIPKLTIAVTPPGPETKVAIDGQPMSNDLLTGVALDPGDHKASAQHGAETVELAFTLAEGERRTIQLDVPVPPPPEPEPPPSKIAEAPKPAPIQPVVQPAPAPFRPASPRGLTPVVPVAFSFAGLGIATGIVTGSVALSQVGALKEQCPNQRCPGPSHDLLSAHQALTTTSTVAFSVGGAAAAAGAIAWLVDSSRRSKAPPDSAPRGASVQVEWLGTGVAVSGTW